MSIDTISGTASKEAANPLDAERQLQNIFQKVGEEHGYETVSAKFTSFKDMKIRWQRSYKWADFIVSDYLNDAPAEIIEEFANILFGKITGEKDNTYSDNVRNWLTDPDFSARKQNIYIRRAKNVSRDGGSYRQLEDSYLRLEKMGLIDKDIENVRIFWTKDDTARKIGSCSVLMRVITISRILDKEDVPEILLDYALYYELCHLMIGFDPDMKMHGKEFEELVNKFEKKAEAEDLMKWLLLTL